MKYSIFILVVVLSKHTFSSTENPPYIKKCSRSDPNLTKCIIESLHHLKSYLATGIEEIEMPSIEPFIMDSLLLQLTGGPQGYRINLKNLAVLGASNFTVKDIKLSQNEEPFEATVYIPKLVIRAKYTSSGVLLIIPASGGGDFHAVFDSVETKLKGVVSFQERENKTYMTVRKLFLVLNVLRPKMRVNKIFNNNRILNEATNLFLRENGQEVLKAMQSQLQTKLASEFANIANRLLKHVPLEQFLSS